VQKAPCPAVRNSADYLGSAHIAEPPAGPFDLRTYSFGALFCKRFVRAQGTPQWLKALRRRFVFFEEKK
jgi:hypothetical protein